MISLKDYLDKTLNDRISYIHWTDEFRINSKLPEHQLSEALGHNISSLAAIIDFIK